MSDFDIICQLVKRHANDPDAAIAAICAELGGLEVYIPSRAAVRATVDRMIEQKMSAPDIPRATGVNIATVRRRRTTFVR